MTCPTCGGAGSLRFNNIGRYWPNWFGSIWGGKNAEQRQCFTCHGTGRQPGDGGGVNCKHTWDELTVRCLKCGEFHDDLQLEE